MSIIIRPRRLRRSKALRDLLAETRLFASDFVFPLFIRHGRNVRQAITSMPGQFQFSVDQLKPEIQEIKKLGIPAVLLFGLPAEKDSCGSSSFSSDGVIQQAIKEIKSLAPELLVITDVCFCEYTDHGHCGVLENGEVHNDKTLELLAKQAVSHAAAGADVVAPSGMMDGMVASIRQALDQHGFEQVAILSYAVKYASAMYGPFREAADGAPLFGDRSTYQMNPANGRRALYEASLDVEQGADMLMVKPAQSYLDVVKEVKQHYPEIPLAAYQVSGTYSMIKAAAEKGYLDEPRVVLETLISIKRAGADFIISYFAKDAVRYLGRSSNTCC